jgi:hypothetical protein
MAPLKKRESASLAQETQPMKSQLLAKITSESITSENENLMAVKIYKTVPETVLDIAARRAREEEIAKNKLRNRNKSRHHAVVLFQVIQ